MRTETVVDAMVCPLSKQMDVEIPEHQSKSISIVENRDVDRPLHPDSVLTIRLGEKSLVKPGKSFLSTREFSALPIDQ